MDPSMEAEHPGDNSSDSGDSASEEALSDTTSLRSSIYAYEIEHGRTYHSFHAGKYHLPNDERERERLDLHYHSMRCVMSDRLFLAPVKDPTNILDVGTGTGIWAMDVADEFPEAMVKGFDLSPIQPMWVPPNLQFEVCDADEEWNYGVDKFDLVHTRFMNGFSIKSWQHFYKEAFEAIKPGGWVENQEFDLMIFSDDNSLSPDNQVLRWINLWEEGIAKFGMSGRCHPEVLESQMRDAGFINVQMVKLKMPVNPWPKDPRLKQAGLYQYYALSDGLSGLSTKVYTQALGWTIDEIEVFLVGVRADMKNRKVHAYFPTYVIYGQKPLPPGAAEKGSTEIPR